MAPEPPTSPLYGPDGTADPPPQPLYPDPLAGLVAGSMPTSGLDTRFANDVFESELVVRAPKLEAPDSGALREAMDAVLAEESKPAVPKPRVRQQPRARREAQQPGMLQQGQRGQSGGRGQGAGQGWSSASAGRPGGARRGAGNQVRRAANRQPAVLIIVVIVVVVVLFNVIRALFEWLHGLFS